MKTQTLIATLVLLGATSAAAAADAAANWGEHCAKCHGVDGKGLTKMGKKLSIRDYTNATVQSSFTDEEALQTLKEGKKDKNGKLLMKPVEGLPEDELKAMVQFVRTLKT
jgi:cytochrome c553